VVLSPRDHAANRSIAQSTFIIVCSELIHNSTSSTLCVEVCSQKTLLTAPESLTLPIGGQDQAADKTKLLRRGWHARAAPHCRAQLPPLPRRCTPVAHCRPRTAAAAAHALPPLPPPHRRRCRTRRRRCCAIFVLQCRSSSLGGSG
jgi:hypothetical protein